MKRLAIANWKMNPDSLARGEKLFRDLKSKAKSSAKVETVVCPPFPFLSTFAKKKGSVSLGAQDLFWEREGAYTGEVSGAMLKSTGVKFVIIGHSERRIHLGETDTIVNKKVLAALAANLRPIICVGENERDHDGRYLRFIKSEVQAALKGVKRNSLSNISIAYEPIWAISNISHGKSAAPRDAFEMKIYIEKIIGMLYTRKIAESVKILYGGSANGENASEFLREGKVDGFLVGGASLKPNDFSRLVKACTHA